MNDDQKLAVAVARIEATLEAVMNMAGHAERSAQQLVRLMEERLMTQYGSLGDRIDAQGGEMGRRLDTVDRRLDDMDRKRDLARSEDERHRTEIATHVDTRTSSLDERIKKLENFRAQLIGVSFGVSALTGLCTALILKAIGG